MDSEERLTFLAFLVKSAASFEPATKALIHLVKSSDYLHMNWSRFIPRQTTFSFASVTITTATRYHLKIIMYLWVVKSCLHRWPIVSLTKHFCLKQLTLGAFKMKCSKKYMQQINTSLQLFVGKLLFNIWANIKVKINIKLI